MTTCGAPSLPPGLEGLGIGGKGWPPVVSVEQAAEMLGVSRAYAYSSIRSGEFPARTVKVGRRVNVVTRSLLKLLDLDA